MKRIVLQLALLVMLGLGLHNANAGSVVVWDGHNNLTTAYGGPVQKETKRALETARRKGWAHATIIASSDTAGYGAIAVALHRNGYGSMIGISLGKRSATEAFTMALEHCRKAGGTHGLK
jgi:hypothetical protein